MCDRRVCVVTGAGRGIGRAHAEALAHEGARVVVNDVGAATDGTGTSVRVAAEVADRIVASGGEAVGDTSDISTSDGAAALIDTALRSFGRLDAVVNNAGILRDKMLVNLTEDDWDAVMRVHVKGTFLVTRSAASHWRERAKEGDVVDARVINTVSAVGLYGQPGQSNYGAAKAAIAGLTLIAAMELERYGVTVNAVCPTALTRMLENTPFADTDEAKQGVLDPRYVSPVVVWLASPLSRGCTGRIVGASGRGLYVAEGWAKGPQSDPVEDPHAVDEVIRALLDAARPNADLRGDVPHRAV